MKTLILFIGIFYCISFAQTPEETPTRDEVKAFITKCIGIGGVSFDGMFVGIEKLGPKTLEHLHSLIGDPDEDKEFRAMVLRAMGELGDKGAIPYLKEYIDDVFMEDEIKSDSEFILYLLGETEKLDTLLKESTTSIQKFFDDQKSNKEVTQEQFSQFVFHIQRSQQLSYRMKKYEITCQSYDLLLRLNPQKFNQHYNFACCLSLAGKIKEALFYLQVALARKEFVNAEGMERDGDLMNLRGEPEFQEFIRKLKAGEPIEMPKPPEEPEEKKEEEKKEGQQ